VHGTSLGQTEDFEDGVMLDIRPAIGFDLIAEPSRTAFSKSVLSSSGINMTGPLTLEQCSGRDLACNVSVEKAFIGALPIKSNNHTIMVLKETFKQWGSVEAIINWKALIERSDIFAKFANNGKGFRSLEPIS
jgi:hypothetical protein